jgi:hypothetical protein
MTAAVHPQALALRRDRLRPMSLPASGLSPCREGHRYFSARPNSSAGTIEPGVGPASRPRQNIAVAAVGRSDRRNRARHRLCNRSRVADLFAIDTTILAPPSLQKL